MANSALKMLAQKAKKRLSTAGQDVTKNDNEKSTIAYLSQRTYAIVASKQKIEEDPLFEKVRKLLESPDTLSPLAELTDHKIFDSLSETEKERYMIDISKRYNEIREYFSKNNHLV